MIGSVALEKIAKIFQCLGMIKLDNLSGSILEFGVFQGYSLSEIALFCRKNNMNNPIFGFDSFQGMPHSEHHWIKGGASSTFENTISELTQKLGNIEDITLVPGFYETSLTSELQSKIPKAVLIHVDCDLYSSTKTALDFCEPLLQEGTFIIFDEYMEPYEAKGWKEFLENKSFLAEYLGTGGYDQAVFRIKK